MAGQGQQCKGHTQDQAANLGPCPSVQATTAKYHATGTAIRNTYPYTQRETQGPE